MILRTAFLLVGTALALALILLFRMARPSSIEDLPSGPSTPMGKSARSTVLIPPVTHDSNPQRSTAIPKSLGLDAADLPHPLATRDEELAGLLNVLVQSKESNEPLPGVRVSLWGTDPPFSSSARGVRGQTGRLGEMVTTSTSGMVEFRVPAGVSAELHARPIGDHAGHEGLQVPPFTDGETRSITLDLPTSADLGLHGRVVSGIDNSPLSGATVSIRSHRRVESSFGVRSDIYNVSLRSQTDDDGYFFIRFKSWQRPTAIIESKGFGPALFVPEKGHETKASAIQLPLMPAGTIAGTVTTQGATDVSGLEVHAQVAGSSICQSCESVPEVVFWNANPDSSGAWLLSGLPPDADIRLFLLSSEKEPVREVATIHLAPGEVRHLDWMIENGASMVGRATIAELDLPLKNHTMWLIPEGGAAGGFFSIFHNPYKSCLTNTEGRFRFNDVPPGRWLVGPAPASRTRADEEGEISSRYSTVEVIEGSSIVDVAIEAHRALYIRGVVLDETGRPAGNRSVSSQAVIGNLFMSCQTDESGAFSLGPLVPGRYRVVARSPFRQAEADSEPVTLMAGEVGVEIRLRGAGTIRGEARCGSLEELGETLVLLRSVDSGDPFLRMVWVDEYGGFEFGGLPPGTYELIAKSSHFAGIAPNVQVAQGELIEGLEIAVDPAAIMMIEHDSARYDNLLYQVTSNAKFLDSGQLEGPSTRVSLPPGEVTVLLVEKQGDSLKVLARQDVFLSGGEERVIRF